MSYFNAPVITVPTSSGTISRRLPLLDADAWSAYITDQRFAVNGGLTAEVGSLNFDAEQDALLNDEGSFVNAVSVPVRKPSVTTKRDRKYALTRQERHALKGRNRMHGKRHKPSAKNIRRWEDCRAQMGRAQVMWHESCTGEIVPVPVNRKYHEKRYLPVDMPTEYPFDWDPWTISDALPDPLPEGQKHDFWKSWDFFCRTTNVRIENAEIRKTRFGFGKNAWHFVLKETGTVYWEDENGQHASDWERETVIY